jgi:ATP cone domain-containing protein
MIRLLEDVAWVKFADGRLAPFDEHRLALSIQRVAEGVGDADWWLAESIAAAVHMYAVKTRSDRIIPISEITEIVGAVLSTLGYEKISQAYEQGPKRVAIRLHELMGRTNAVLELEFFQRLDRALGVAASSRLSVIEVNGLRTCVMRLRGARRWTEGCRRLAEEIVTHVRERVVRVRSPRAGCLKLAVLE